MRRALLTLLALIGVVSALVVTASSTTRQAAEAGMTGAVGLSLVGLLEVVNVAGTWTWITDQRRHVRLEAAVGVGLASTVTGVCGALTYGALGLVAPAGLLAAVHLVSRMWTAVPAAVPDPGPPAAPALEAPALESVVEPLAELAGDVEAAPEVDPGPADRSGPGTAPWSDEDVLADLRARGEVDPSPRSLRSLYGMRHDRAVRLVAEHADRADRSATVEAGTGVAP